MFLTWGWGRLVFEHVANHEPLIVEVDTRWVDMVIGCIGGEVRVVKTLDGLFNVPKLVFNRSASPSVNHSV